MPASSLLQLLKLLVRRFLGLPRRSGPCQGKPKGGTWWAGVEGRQERALGLHLKFMHDVDNAVTKKDVGYELVYEFKG